MSNIDRLTNEAILNSERMMENAQETTDLLKSVAHAGRLLILCCLVEKPSTVGELEDRLSIRQASISKQLARLREEGLVKATRNGRHITYTLSDERVRALVQTLYGLFCEQPKNTN